jgi:transcription antitermination protein NusB
VTARSKARKRALDILFEAELRDVSPLEVLRERQQSHPARAAGYAADLVRGVQLHQREIDDLLSRHAHGWTLDRMPAVDRNILRIGTHELLWAADVPDAVVINEAVQLAQDLSTDASAGFVNGLLARLLERKPELAAGGGPGAERLAGQDGPGEPEPPRPEADG